MLKVSRYGFTSMLIFVYSHFSFEEILFIGGKLFHQINSITTEGDMSMQIMKIKKCLFCHGTCFWNNTILILILIILIIAQEAIKDLDFPLGLE